MNKMGKKLRDAIFVVTDERSCPIYNVGEEFKVENLGLTVPSLKPGCLLLAQEIAKVVSSRDIFSGYQKFGSQKSRFNCGGCDGLLQFEFKKERDFTTVQMKLLNETEERKRRNHLDKFFGVLRGLDIFESLDDDALIDFTLLLELRNIPFGKIVIRQGDPGTHLYIILSGGVSVIAEDGAKIAEMGPGKIFGEMSLLSGEPVTNSIHTQEATQVAMLSLKNFRHVLKKYPVLQLFLLRLLVDRAQAMTLRSGKISSGMTGELAEIHPVDLFQLINSSQRTGTIDMSLEKGKASVFFRDGEIVYARFLDLRDKDAVFALLAARKGHFSFIKGIPAELSERRPIGSFMAMMMEGVQILDESPG